MAVRRLLFLPNTRSRLSQMLNYYYYHHLSPNSHSLSSLSSTLGPPSSPPATTATTDAIDTDTVSDICRILSDYRSPHHDIDSALQPFADSLSPPYVEHVLRRCRNLPVSSLRFFLFSSNLPSFQHTPLSYRILFDILGSSHNFPLIWDLLSQLRSSSSSSSSSSSFISPQLFWIIFRSYSRAKLPLDAIRSFGKMPDYGITPTLDDLHHLLSLLSRNGFVSHAQDFLDEVRLRFPVGVKTYSILIKGWGDRNDGAGARKVFDEMLERGCEPDVVAYNSLLAALCRGGMVDEAFEAFREMRSRGLDADARTYAAFVHAYCRTNDVRSTVRTLDRMRRHDLVPDVFTYNCVIKLLCGNGGIDDAHKLLDEMLERGASPDVWSYNAILASHCDRREVNRALGLFRRMKRDSIRPDRHTYNMLLKMLIGVGRIDRAVEVWEGMEERGFYPSVTTYAVMVHGLAKKKGRVEDACRFFEMMVDEGIPPYACTCTLLRDRLLHLGLRDRIFILAEKMRQSTSCAIQELSDMMSSSYFRPKRVDVQLKEDDTQLAEASEPD